MATMPGGEQGEDDADERAGAGAAVDHGGLLQFARDVDDEAAQRPHGEREDEGQVGDDQAGEPVVLAEVVQQQEDRDDHRDERDHLDREDADDDDLAAAEGEPGDGERGERADDDADEDDREGHDQAAADGSPEVGDVQGPAEVVEGEAGGQQARVRVDGVLGRFERRVEHPVQREAGGEEDQQADQVPAEAGGAAGGAHRGAVRLRDRGGAHSTSPIFSIWRMYTATTPSRRSTVSRAMAEPCA
ncbi:hypothetical protein GCM10020256_23970 [Streptomyces thermocoprophilus]